MFVETVKSDGLAHLSYLVGSETEAAVIDPRRDCDIYVEKARARGCRITRIFETHRNEDLISGAPILAAMTGASVHHGPNADGEVRYADTVREGAAFTLGKARIEVLETPGHTYDSISFVLFDEEFDDGPVGVFTGDALFVGDVGRTDFYPDRAEEVAGLLFDSLRKILSLGDQAILYPAHGAGSVCGDNMADREFSTLGHERRNNPRLAISDRDAFIAAKLREHHDLPPYFHRMERLNLEGADAPPRVTMPRSLAMTDIGSGADTRVLLDIRGVTDFLGAHLPGSLAIPTDMLPAFAGWLIDPDSELVLIADDPDQAQQAMLHLLRMGFDRIAGAMTTALPGWASSGRAFGTVPALDAEEVAERIGRSGSDDAGEWKLLDVRRPAETESGMIPGARNIYLGQLPARLDGLSPENRYIVLCESGARATIAASVLLRAGFENVAVFLGSMGAWRAADKPMVEPREP